MLATSKMKHTTSRRKKLNCHKPICCGVLLMKEHQEENRINQLTIESQLSKQMRNKINK
jgi:hypothetical protein